MAGKLIGFAIKAAVKGAVKVAKMGQLNAWTQPVPVKYTEGGRERYAVYLIAEERRLGNGPTLLVAGDVDRDSAAVIEKNLINGAARRYVDLLFQEKKDKIERGKLRVLEDRIKGPDPGYEQVYATGQMLVDLVKTMTFRKMLKKYFRGSGYNFWEDSPNVIPDPPKAEKFRGKYLMKYEEETGIFSKKMTPYVIPVEGVPRTWYRTIYIDMSSRQDFMDLVRRAHELRYRGVLTREDIAELREVNKQISRYLKAFIEGKI